MRLKDTGLTAQELKDMVNKYMVETYERYDFIAERAEGMYLYDEAAQVGKFWFAAGKETPLQRNLWTACQKDY